MTHDPMLDGIQRYEPYEKFGCGGHSEGDFVLDDGTGRREGRYRRPRGAVVNEPLRVCSCCGMPAYRFRPCHYCRVLEGRR
jgi:hypothetical protein